MLRLIEIMCGAFLCYAVYRMSGAALPPTPGSRARLMLTPYVAATIPYLLATFLVPSGWHIILIGAVPAALIGQGILPLLAFSGKTRIDASANPEVIRFSWPASLLGALCVLSIIYVAPGFHFTL